MSVGLALIVRDEEKVLPTLLRSVEGCFDQVVLLDTGSKDKTIALFEAWAQAEHERHPGFTGISAEGKWNDDFASARRAAHQLLETDWQCWADADDEIVGAAAIRQLCDQAPADLAGYVSGYDYAQDPVTGHCVCYLRRERVVRRGRGAWVGRVHEAQIVDGPVLHTPDDVVLWRHAKHIGRMGESGPRNLRILRAWNRDEPDNPRVLMYLGAEYLARGRARYSIRYFNRYLRLKHDWDEERAQQCRRLAVAHMALDDRKRASEAAYEGLHVKPSWPDSYLTLAQLAYLDGRNQRAIEWAQLCIEIGRPQTLLIINPLDYTYEPMKVKAGALAALGQLDEAIEIGERALELVPHDQQLRGFWQGWRNTQETARIAETFTRSARYLVMADEQEKAQRLLTCVPHVAARHPSVVALRSEIDDRVRPLLEDARTHYRRGGVNPEHGMDLDTGRAFAEQLPRAGFAAGGILSQLAEPERAAEMTGNVRLEVEDEPAAIARALEQTAAEVAGG